MPDISTLWLLGLLIIILFLSWRWAVKEKRNKELAYDLSMARDQLRAAGEVIERQDKQLIAAHNEIARLSNANCKLAKERPMMFRSVPLCHAAHLHLSRCGRQLWLTWDN